LRSVDKPDRIDGRCLFCTRDIGTKAMNTEFGALFELSVPRRLELVEELWNSIAAAPEELPVTCWQKAELARRKAEFLRNPESGVPWEEAKERIRGRNG
jgi:putative addiction module component (TIGR02574 family)